MVAVSLRNLPIPLRALFSSFLVLIGTGYLAAILYLFLVDVAPHQAKGQGLIEGISEKYHGVPTRLEAALRGPMAARIGPQDKERIFSWIASGAEPQGYQAIKPILEANCIACHRVNSDVRKPNGQPLPSFERFDAMSRLIEIDTGPTIAQLAKVSHVHLFGISIIFFLTGFIIALSETAVWFRVLLIVTPYAAIFADVGAWWLTKLEAVFAWIVVTGGALMGLALACQILVALWEMWVASRSSPLPSAS
jgi:hypothetical protein